MEKDKFLSGDISTRILQLAAIAKEAGLIQFIRQQITEAENLAEEYIQELDNFEAGEKQLSKIEAYKNVLEWIGENHFYKTDSEETDIQP